MSALFSNSITVPNDTKIKDEPKEESESEEAPVDSEGPSEGGLLADAPVGGFEVAGVDGRFAAAQASSLPVSRSSTGEYDQHASGRPASEPR